MKRTRLLQEIRMMHYEEIMSLKTEKHLTYGDAARMLNVSERTLRRYRGRHDEDGLDGLLDKRLSQGSARKAPVDEVLTLVDRYCSDHRGWRVKHFYSWYRRDGGTRSYTWVKNELQRAKAVPKAARRGVHRKRRERAPLVGMLIHQDGSTHEWVPGQKWDLIVTMDDATSEHYSMIFVHQEGTNSSFVGVRDVIQKHGLFANFYSDRGSHYWHTKEAGGKVDKKHLTQFGRAMQQLGIDMIAAYSPEARGRSERMFSTHQNRLVKELAYYGITTMEEANRYLRETYMPAFNAEFTEAPAQAGSSFVPLLTPFQADDILCEHHDRIVGRDNCVNFERLTLQIPSDDYRCNYIKAKVRVLRYLDGSLAICHGPRKLANYRPNGTRIILPQKQAA